MRGRGQRYDCALRELRRATAAAADGGSEGSVRGSTDGAVTAASDGYPLECRSRGIREHKRPQNAERWVRFQSCILKALILGGHEPPLLAPYGVEGLVETTTNILTIKEVADILRCSKTHAQNVIEGKVNGLPKLTHLSLGRRKVVRKEWLDQWMEANKTR